MARGSAPAARLLRRLPFGDRGLVLDPAARPEPDPRGARLLRPDDQVPGRTRLAVLDLGLEAVRRRLSRSPPRSAGPGGPARDRSDRPLFRPSPQDVTPAPGAHPGLADRGRGRPVPPVL